MVVTTTCAPVVALLYVDDRRDAVGAEEGVEGFPRLRFEFEAINEEEDAMGVFGAQVELGNGGAEERLAGAGGHFEEETVLAGGGGFLEGVDGGDLVIAEQADLFVYADHAFFRFGVGRPGGVLGNGDVGFVHGDGGEPCAVGLPRGGPAEFGGGQETRDTDGVSLREIPVVVEQAVAQENVRDLEAFGVGAGLFFGGERVDGFLLGLDHGDRSSVGCEKDVVNKTAGRVLVVGAEIGVGRKRFSGDAVFADDVFAPTLRIGEEPPACLLQKLVDGDACLGFGGHVDWSWSRHPSNE